MMRYGLALAVGLSFGLIASGSACGQEATSSQPGDLIGEVVPVKFASAAEVARVLDSLFNGSGTDRKTRIEVFVIPLTNWLFVRGTRNDLVTIRELLKPL